MVSKEKRAERKAAGLCVLCGKVREGRGCTACCCGACAQRNREVRARFRWRKEAYPERYTPEGREARRSPSWREWRRILAEKGRCVRCRRLFPSDAERRAGFLSCQDCRRRNRQSARGVAERKREAAWARGEHAGAMPPRGYFPPLGKTRKLSFRLDFGTAQAIWTLKERDCERRQRPNLTATPMYQTSRVIRETILRFEKSAHCPVRKSGYRLMTEMKCGFRADSRIEAIVRRHACDRGGNASATICDILVYAAATSGFRGATGGPCLSAHLIAAG